MRQAAIAAQVEAGIELHQVLIARPVLRQQHDRRGRARALAGLHRVVIEIGLAPTMGCTPAPAQVRKTAAPRTCCWSRSRRRRACRGLAQIRQFLHRNGAFEKAVFGVKAKMDESGAAHGPQSRRDAGRRELGRADNPASDSISHGKQRPGRRAAISNRFANRPSHGVLRLAHAARLSCRKIKYCGIFPHCLKVLSPSRGRHPGALPQGGKIAFLCGTGKGAMALRRIGPAHQGARPPDQTATRDSE